MASDRGWDEQRVWEVQPLNRYRPNLEWAPPGDPGARRRATPRPPFLASLVLLVLAFAGGDAAAQAPFVEPDEEAVPVLLVPGWGDHAPDLAALSRRFADSGWPETRISAVTFRDPVGSNRRNAEEVGIAVRLLQSRTGAERVDIVAHSMGGLAVRHYLQFNGGASQVRRVVFLGTPHRGTVAAILAWGEGGREMVPGSDFLNELNEGNPVPDGVEALAIRSAVDLRVIPQSSAMLPGARNMEICCPTHPGLVEDEGTFEAIRQFLRAGPDELAEPDDSIPIRTPRGDRSRR